MPPPDTDLAARVRAGMAFLDQRLGAGWESVIDLERLDMTSGDRCLLGQLGDAKAFGPLIRWTPYAGVLRTLGWSADYASIVRHGFAGSYNDAVALTAEWRAQLAARRATKETTE